MLVLVRGISDTLTSFYLLSNPECSILGKYKIPILLHKNNRKVLRIFMQNGYIRNEKILIHEILC